MTRPGKRGRVANHVLPADLGEIRNIVQEIEGRIARSRQRFGNGE